jgi:ligand-binding SRPBCC domain-containing protein
MPIIELVTLIHAPVERCFDLSRSLDLHMTSTAHTGEKAVAGVTSGLINYEEEVTWRARHFGVWQHLTSRITAFDRPRHFRDTMVRGAFKYIEHDHYFEPQGGATKMTDVLDFAAPFGFLGRMAETLVLTKYLRQLLEERNACIKRTAETEEWKRYLPNAIL